MISAVVGLNWGDEAKGRMVDYLSEKADCVVRFQGGDNAGHTIENEFGRFALHNLPGGVFRKNVKNLIAPGSVVNLESLVKELDDLKKKGIDAPDLLVSDRAIIIFPFHILMDKLEEERLADKKYGSTLSGIAPVYGLKYLKKGIQAGELFYPEYLKKHLVSILEYVNLIITGVYGGTPLDAGSIMEWTNEYGNILKPLITDINPLLEQYNKADKNIILEAQLGALRDITHGIYPYTTSSSTLAGYACASLPFRPSKLSSVIGVTKAYSTCVGEGPFVTEINDPTADVIRQAGNEFGAKTGRPRRIGWFDSVATRYGAYLQGADSMAVSCLDVLTGQSELKICTAYEINGKVSGTFPINPELDSSKPVYEIMPGWNEDIRSVRRFEDLPEAAIKYVKRLEELVGLPVRYISVGPERNEIVIR